MAHIMELLTAKSKHAQSLLREERDTLGGISMEELNRLIYAQVLASHPLTWQVWLAPHLQDYCPILTDDDYLILVMKCKLLSFSWLHFVLWVFAACFNLSIFLSKTRSWCLGNSTFETTCVYKWPYCTQGKSPQSVPMWCLINVGIICCNMMINRICLLCLQLFKWWLIYSNLLLIGLVFVQCSSMWRWIVKSLLLIHCLWCIGFGGVPTLWPGWCCNDSEQGMNCSPQLLCPIHAQNVTFF